MTGLPTLLVELDDDTGTFPHNITGYVHMPTGIGVTHGRQDEFSQVEAARLSLRLDNVDGRFTTGSPTYGVHVDQRIRFTETVGTTVSKRFTGYVQDWPLSWPSPTATMATVTISAFDRFTRMARRKLRSLIESEVLSDSPLAYYTLGEPVGSASAGDTSGNGMPALTATGTGPAVAFGTAFVSAGASEEATAATFAGGKYLAATLPETPASAGLRLEAFALTAAPGGIAQVDGETPSYLRIECDGPTAQAQVLVGFGVVTMLTGTTNIMDGALHHVAAQVTWGGAFELYVDGVLEGTTSGPMTGFVPRVLSVGPSFVGTIAHVALSGAAVPSAQVANHADAGLTGFAAQSSDNRIARLAAYARLSPGDLNLEVGAAEVPTQTIVGVSPLDAMRAVETAEGGVLFVAGDGRLTFHNRTHRVLTSTGTPALAITAADVDHDDLTISTDKTYLQNTVTGSRSGGATQTVVSAASVATYDEYPGDYSDLLVGTDAEVLARINWQAGAYDDVAPRLSSVTIDLLTASQAIQEAVLATEIGDRITISGMPTQSPFATADLIVEGWSERAASGAWSITFNTAPAELFRAWVLGDPVYGVLGSTTRLHF